MGNVGAIILAAGGSSRFRRAKQLLLFQGATLLRHAVDAASQGGCTCIAVVVGEMGDLIRVELRDTSAEIVENPQWQRGLGTSIRCGLQHLTTSRHEIAAVVLLACDQPFVDAGTVCALIAEHERSGKPIIASHYADTVGIPALFHRACFKSLGAVADDSGAKSIIERQPSAVAQVEFARGAIDIDTPEDYERLTALP